MMMKMSQQVSRLDRWLDSNACRMLTFMKYDFSDEFLARVANTFAPEMTGQLATDQSARC